MYKFAQLANLDVSMKRLIFLAIWVCVLDVANAERIMCIVEEAVLCQAGQCKEIYQEGGYATVIDTTEQVYVLADFNKEKYEPFPLIEHEEAGAFTLYTTGLGGAVMKVANQTVEMFGFEKNSFVEVRLSMLNTFVSTGTCQKIDG